MSGYKRVLKHRFGDLLPLLSDLQDSRKRKDYRMEETVMGAIALFLFKQWLREYRLLNKYYLVAVDATLEAKLVTRDGLCLSPASEWIENPEGNCAKQDCERKAFVRLAAKLKKNYPRLPICIQADGLYPYQDAFEVCEKNDRKYIYVLQDGSLKTVQEELVLTKRRKPAKEHYCVKAGNRISSQYRFQTNILLKVYSCNST